MADSRSLATPGKRLHVGSFKVIVPKVHTLPVVDICRHINRAVAHSSGRVWLTSTEREVEGHAGKMWGKHTYYISRFAKATPRH